MSDALSRLLAQKDVVLADGASGTSFFQLGMHNRSSGELWNVENPDLVACVHQGFVDAGSDILLTNTFGANCYRLGLHKLADRARELNMAAVKIVRAVADRANRPIAIAGAIGPIGDIPESFGTRTVAEAEEAFFEQAQTVKEGGVDIDLEPLGRAGSASAAARSALRCMLLLDGGFGCSLARFSGRGIQLSSYVPCEGNFPPLCESSRDNCLHAVHELFEAFRVVGYMFKRTSQLSFL